MKDGVLFYDGATYELNGTVVADLLERGVILLDKVSGYYELARNHAIDEVEADANVLSRLTGSVARAQDRPDVRSLGAELKAPNGFGGRR